MCVGAQIDGFRFDIMGHLMLSTMTKLQAALKQLTPDKDGVDGSGIYIYGEGWDFGEVGRRASAACESCIRVLQRHTVRSPSGSTMNLPCNWHQQGNH